MVHDARKPFCKALAKEMENYDPRNQGDSLSILSIERILWELINRYRDYFDFSLRNNKIKSCTLRVKVTSGKHCVPQFFGCFFAKNLISEEPRGPTSSDAIKISTDSLEISWQDSNFFMNFWSDLWFLQTLMLTLLKQIFGLISCAKRVQNGITMEKGWFFKVAECRYFHHDVTTKKKHLTKVSSELKTFYDYFRRSWNNLTKAISLYYENHVLQQISKERCRKWNFEWNKIDFFKLSQADRKWP